MENLPNHALRSSGRATELDNVRGMKTETPTGRRSVLLPEGALPARVIVCERTGRWAVALRRELAGAGVRIRETRSLAECWEMLAESPGGFVVVELSAVHVDALLRQMTRLERDFPLARVAIVADRSLAHYEWLLREAGAAHFTTSTGRLGPVAQLACRHLAEAPSPPRTAKQEIWARLPWGDDE